MRKPRFFGFRKKKKKKKKSNLILTIILMAAIAVGLGILLYTSVADNGESSRQSGTIVSYQEKVDNLGREEHDKLWDEAVEWNKNLVADYAGPDTLNDHEAAEYNRVLDVTGTGIMGYVTIQKTGDKLPVYHGTDKDNGQGAAGHLEWSSLPVGGKDTHCVIWGCSGVSDGKLLAGIDKLNTGDTFTLTTLNDNLSYEVDQILVVDPEEVKDMYQQRGKDLCTLVTCTPNGVDSHRLLVRGHRIPNESGTDFNVRGDAAVINPFKVALILAIPGLAALFVWVMLQLRKGKRRRKRVKKLRK